MGARNQQVLDEIFVFDRCRAPSGSAAALRLIISERLCFSVAAVGNGYHTIFFRNQVFNGQIMCRIGNLRSALVAELFDQLFQFFTNNLLQAIGIPEYVEVVCDFSNFVSVLLQ